MNGHVLLVRHGETSANVARLLDTALPGAALTERGHEQARALRGDFAQAADTIAAIWHSEALRAQQTAGELEGLVEGTLLEKEGVHETQVGALEGRGDVDALTTFAETYQSWLQGDFARAFPDGESAHDVLDRYLPVVDEANREVRGEADQSLVIVSHAAAIRLAAFHLAGMSPEFVYRNHLDNTAVVDLRQGSGGRWECVSWGGVVPQGSDYVAL